MKDSEVVLAMTNALDEANCKYMIVGSLSSNAYGIPRATQDADFVVDADGRNIAAISKSLPAQLSLDPQMSFETVTATHRLIVTQKKGHYKVELFFLSDDAHDRERFRRRVQGEVFGKPVWLPTAEDVIISKLRWCGLANQAKDMDDIRGVLLVQQDAIDEAYLRRWCEIHGTRELLERIRSELPREP